MHRLLNSHCWTNKGTKHHLIGSSLFRIFSNRPSSDRIWIEDYQNLPQHLSSRYPRPHLRLWSAAYAKRLNSGEFGLRLLYNFAQNLDFRKKEIPHKSLLWYTLNLKCLYNRKPCQKSSFWKPPKTMKANKRDSKGPKLDFQAAILDSWLKTHPSLWSWFFWGDEIGKVSIDALICLKHSAK